MDLTAAAVSFQQAKLSNQVDVQVASKVLNEQRAEGASAIQLLNSASAGLIKGGDALVAAATGVGGNVDAYA